MTDWITKAELGEVSSTEVRYSKGLLSSDLIDFFAPLSAFWKTFFVSVDVIVSDVRIRPSLLNEESLTANFIAKSEFGLFGISIDASSARVLATALQLQNDDSDATLSEYLSRRFVFSVSKTAVLGVTPQSGWTFHASDNCEAFARIEVELIIANQSVHLEFLLDEDIAKRVDAAAKKQAISRRIKDQSLLYSDKLSPVRVELAQLLVEPAKLIDCVRIGNQIDLGQLSFQNVAVKLADKSWLQGELLLHDNRFAVKTASLAEHEQAHDVGKTAVQFCFREMELDQRSIAEQEQLGAVLLCPQRRDDILEIRLGEESVGYAQLEHDGESYKATVCTKG